MTLSGSGTTAHPHGVRVSFDARMRECTSCCGCAHCVFYASANPSISETPAWISQQETRSVSFVTENVVLSMLQNRGVVFPLNARLTSSLPSSSFHNFLAVSEKQQDSISDIWQHCVNAISASTLLL